jgi:S1-C subfamily serine protease
MNVEVNLKRRISTAVAVTRDTQRFRWRGLLFGPIPGNWDAGKGNRNGVIVLGVASNSPLASKVTVGSIVTSIAGKPLHEIRDLQAILNDTPSENCNIEVVHGSEPQIASMSASGN